MKVTTGTIYEAFDGTKFTTEYDCAKYETEQKLIKTGLDIKRRYEEVMKDIKHYCGQMLDEECDDYEGINVCISDTCPFYNEDYAQHCTLDKIPHIDD